jgi:hypothetical protein
VNISRKTGLKKCVYLSKKIKAMLNPEDYINKAKVSHTQMLLHTVSSSAVLIGNIHIIMDLLIRVLANQEGKTEEDIREELLPLIKDRQRQAIDELEEWGLKNSI